MILLRLLKESLLFAYNSLIVNKLRTFLSLLGITIGIFAIISVFTVIDSLEYSIRNSIESLGDDVVYIQKWPWEFSSTYPWWKYVNRPVPNLKELDEILRRSNKVETAAFIASTNQNIYYKDNAGKSMSVMCASHSYEDIWTFEIEKGRYFSSMESSLGDNIAIIGNDIAKILFDNINPVNKTIKIRGNKVRIIGVFEKEGNSIGESLDDVVLLPVNYAKKIFDIRSQRMNPFIMAKAKDNVSSRELIDELTGLMRSIRRQKPMADNNFALNRASIIITQFESVFAVINIAGWIIGGFSILVGAFGIANIMFVSVRERTNIIGIQKAMGSKNYFILTQFLYESIILALIGGALGLLLIYFGLFIANSQDIEMEFTLTFSNILRGLTISVVIGIIAGFVPAWYASRLNPVEAIQATV